MKYLSSLLFIKIILTIAVVCLSMFSQGYASGKLDSPWQGVSFSATLVSYHQSKPDDMQKGRVYIGKLGMRQESVSTVASESEYVDSIFDIKNMKSYMLNIKKKTYFEVPVDESDNEKNIIPGGLFTNKPCEGFSRRKSLKNRKFQQRTVAEWRCESQKSYVLQYYDEALKTVIREEKEDGSVEELRDIVLQEHPAHLFLPPEGYKKISMQEFFTGIPKFDTYQETGKEGDFEPAKNPDQLPGYQ